MPKLSVTHYLLVLVVGIAIGAGAIYYLDRVPAGSLGDALRAARRYGDDARASAERLSVGLGQLVTDLDGSLAATGKIVDLVSRLRARDRVYAEVAERLRVLARELGATSEVPEP